MFAVTMMTVDRSPRQNYLVRTLENLKRSGVFQSPLLHSFHLCVSRKSHRRFAMDAWAEVSPGIMPTIHCEDRLPTENAAYALRCGAQSGAPWTLFLEDDIDVCDKFLESTAAWLTQYESGFEVFPLGANYDFINDMHARGEKFWSYPVNDFYGTLAVAMRAMDANSIAVHLNAHLDKHTYDLHMTEWAKQRRISHFLTPVPSFVQHIGNESFIRPGSDPIVYKTWLGREWSYAKDYHGAA